MSAAQIKFGSKYGNLSKKPSFGNVLGKFCVGFAKRPPILGPKIVPTDQTKGMTAYAFAVHLSVTPYMSMV